MTAVAILGHAALGCCWHHAHSAPAGNGSVAQYRHDCGSNHVQTVEEGHNHFLDLFGERPEEGPTHDHVPCQDSSCTYLTTKSVELTDGSCLPMAIGPMLTPAISDASLGRLEMSTLARAVPDFGREHCALTQVWRL